MELKYVGDMPIISQHGVSFDKTQADRYKFLYAGVELLEALSYGESETTQHLYKAQDKELSPSELMEIIKKYIKNIDEIFASCDHKAHEFIHEIVNRVKANDSLTPDERTAWLENIKIMRAYYYQYIINQSAYETVLEVLGDEIHDARIQEVRVPMCKNYPAVLNDLVGVLEQRKASIDSQVKIEKNSEGLIAKIIMRHLS